MGYAINEYGHDLTADERKEKALSLAASYWGQWQWYEMRRPVLDALRGGQKELDRFHSLYTGAESILRLVYDMDASEIKDYCGTHVSYLLDDHALDVDMWPMTVSPWIDGPRSVDDEQ